MREGSIVRETDVYSAPKARVDEDRSMGPLDHLRRLDKFLQYYTVLLRPQHEPSVPLRERLLRLNRLEVTVAYPFLLNVYADHARGALSEADVIDLLDTLESFLVRRSETARAAGEQRADLRARGRESGDRAPERHRAEAQGLYRRAGGGRSGRALSRLPALADDFSRLAGL
jgi:hypothetical protein